ncbi:A-kinase anchor protein 10, mitochondrial-like [Diadema antillarum]|uniref:A-kinase anchor protein 10, mitochondrial-like n=1 Tax=Diadema antillarum TaxID=105358 RepID=UPI003A88A45D
MPLFKRKSEKQPQQRVVRQSSKPENPAVKGLQQKGGKPTHQQAPQSGRPNAQPQHGNFHHAGAAAMTAITTTGHGQHGSIPGGGAPGIPGQGPPRSPPDPSKADIIDDGTAALAASKRGSGIAVKRMISDEDDAMGDLGKGIGKIEQTDQPINRSRLCKSLNEVLHDNGALPYFIQYMASCDRKQLVQFWLAAESFSNASWSKMRTDSMSAGTGTMGSHLTTTIPEDRSETDDQNCNTNSSTSSRNGVSVPSSKMDATERIIEESRNNNVISLPGEGTKEDSALSRMNSDGKVVEPTISPSKEVTQNASPAGSPTKSKTHTRAMSDSAVGVGKMFGGKTEGGFEPGHRRNNSWKEVDPRTAVERDAINIFTRYICKDAIAPVGVPEQIRLDIIGKICPKDGQFDPDSFKDAQKYAFMLMDKQYFQSFLRSEFHCKYQIDVLTSGRVYLADILYNDSATFYFMEYLEQENAVHLLQFWLAGENFQQHLLSQQGQYDPVEAQSDAMVLYDKYFSLQATNPIGFDDNIRFEVESNICREGGPLPTCFAAPMRQAYTTLETMYFQGFLQSDLYYKFLSELINTIKSEQAQAAGGTGSIATAIDDDQSSTSSDPATRTVPRNTLLAEGNVVKLFEGDMNIDPVKFDPDSLWQRSKPQNMMFGKVNHLGQFVPEYEPDPESLQKRNSSTKFSLKKLVTKDEDKSKEEMALKIAQMIINDVNMQTQGLAGSDIPSPTTARPGKLTGS